MSDSMSQQAEAAESGLARLIGKRLKDARFILAATGLATGALVAAGTLPPAAGLALLVVLVVSAALPRRSRTMRLAERRQNADLAWPRAIELPLEAMDDPAYLLRPDGTVKYQNAAAIRLFGPSGANAHLSARIRSPAILEIVQQATESGEATAADYAERVPSERWFRVRCAPVAGTPGGERGARLFLLTFRDMTEARRMDRMRTDFVANASHELRTPLASLTGFIETIRGPARNDAAARDRFLDIMHEQATRMTRLVNDLMSLSRLEMKTHLVPTERVELAQLLRHVCDALRPLADELGVELHLDVPGAPVEVYGDRDELIQVFENLIENACKYGQSGGRVETRMAVLPSQGPEGADLVEVTVRDFGPGIAAQHVPRLTERFYRIDVESSRSKRGTGLGLAIVKHILTRHRTRLIVRSAIDEGSSFIVRFDRAGDVDSVGSSQKIV